MRKSAEIQFNNWLQQFLWPRVESLGRYCDGRLPGPNNPDDYVEYVLLMLRFSKCFDWHENSKKTYLRRARETAEKLNAEE